MKIGDKVKFLNESGGGIVTGFQGKNIVLVEDSDGFAIPMTIGDVVLVEEKAEQKVEENIDAQNIPVPEIQPVERNGGDKLLLYLAFVPINIRELTTTRYELYLVNDCNYFINFIYCKAKHSANFDAKSSNWSLHTQGTVDPNTLLFLEEYGVEQLNEISSINIQTLAYKTDKTFAIQPTCDHHLEIEPIKFIKLHSYKDNDFFETPAMIFDITESKQKSYKVLNLKDYFDTKRNAKDFSRKYDADHSHKPNNSKHNKQDTTIVVDLHAHELLDTTVGMSNADILNYQIDVARKTLDANKSNKLQKIVFIHGKGEGVLRKALIDVLKKHYSKYTYQDASFRDYGFGATMVTIR